MAKRTTTRHTTAAPTLPGSAHWHTLDPQAAPVGTLVGLLTEDRMRTDGRVYRVAAWQWCGETAYALLDPCQRTMEELADGRLYASAQSHVVAIDGVTVLATNTANVNTRKRATA